MFYDTINLHLYWTMTLCARFVVLSLASLIADPGVVSLIWAQPHAFMEFDQEILSSVIDRFKKGCCQLQVKVCAQSTPWLTLLS